jgi:hypothetical protein
VAFSDLMSRLSPKKRKADKAREELKANAEKALRMKQEASPSTHIPDHHTAREGMQDHHHVEIDRAREAGFTPQMKRSKVGRSGETS